MQDVVSPLAAAASESTGRLSRLIARTRAESPSIAEYAVALLSAVLLIASFPNFDLWPLAWIGLAPLLLLIARKPQPVRCFVLGWLFGSVFFYGSCYWLTYSMIHFGGLPPIAAYILLAPGAVVLGTFPALFALLLARCIRRFGTVALFLAPLFWAALEWLRLETTGQLWNALGYSQAFHPALIQAARWGGVYGISFLLVAVNAAIGFAVLKRGPKASLISAGVVALVVVLILFCVPRMLIDTRDSDAVVVAIQPNVPMDLVKSNDDLRMLTARHFEMSEAALSQLAGDEKPRLVIWPESPMNFTYGTNSQLRDLLSGFAQKHHTSVLLNSQEVAPNDGVYNSAVLINEQGSLVAQYDKIRLLPFGEYVPLPKWIPGAGLIRGIVGDFTPGANYRLMQVGGVRAGVFICIESAYPAIARRFSHEGADVLINISNDGYLGPTAVMRQHLSNAVFRAVENGRPVLRVTNSGISAWITPAGNVQDATQGFTPEVRIWDIARSNADSTFYAKHGDVFVVACAILSLAIIVLSFVRPYQTK